MKFTFYIKGEIIIEDSKTFNNNQYRKFVDIQELSVVHSNCMEARFDRKDIKYITNSEDVLAICLYKNYKADIEGLVRWESIPAFDKDEITMIYGKDSYDYEFEIRVPFKNISTSGSYAVNEKSEKFETDNHILIEWYK